MNIRKELERDRSKSSVALYCEYSQDGGGEHPVFTRLDWRTDVAKEETIFGYWDWDWVAQSIYIVFSEG